MMSPSPPPLGDQLAQVAAAFDRKAAVYDAFGQDHENLSRMRRKVYAHLGRLLAPGAYLLELNAGTGLDAAHLARRGYRVHATDLAPAMVAEIRAKAAAPELVGRLTTQQCSFTDLDAVRHGPFDGIYSNFGGLNCIADLGPVTVQLPRLLRPGGLVTWVIMPRICPWELLLSARNPRVGLRRLRPGGVRARVEGVHFQTYYYSVRQVRRVFGPAFRPVAQEGLSVLTPTADNKTFARRHPGLFRRLCWWDDRLSRWPPFNGWGDFYILSLRYEG